MSKLKIIHKKLSGIVLTHHVSEATHFATLVLKVGFEEYKEIVELFGTDYLFDVITTGDDFADALEFCCDALRDELVFEVFKIEWLCEKITEEKHIDFSHDVNFLCRLIKYLGFDHIKKIVSKWWLFDDLLERSDISISRGFKVWLNEKVKTPQDIAWFLCLEKDDRVYAAPEIIICEAIKNIIVNMDCLIACLSAFSESDKNDKCKLDLLRHLDSKNEVYSRDSFNMFSSERTRLAGLLNQDGETDINQALILSLLSEETLSKIAAKGPYDPLYGRLGVSSMHIQSALSGATTKPPTFF